MLLQIALQITHLTYFYLRNITFMKFISELPSLSYFDLTKCLTPI